jgi:hypothetical protein
MKVPQDLLVGLKDARFVVFDRLLTAEGLDNLAGFGVVVSRQGRKQVMLYLVIQAAIPYIRQWAALYVSGGKYLHVQEIQPFVHQRHGLVIRRETCAHVQAGKNIAY